jgi:predicted  nucleic acid-binding Zn-ribbon protein
VEERTNELKEKVAELERMNDLFVGREFRIKELRDRVRELELKI